MSAAQTRTTFVDVDGDQLTINADGTPEAIVTTSHEGLLVTRTTAPRIARALLEAVGLPIPEELDND